MDAHKRKEKKNTLWLPVKHLRKPEEVKQLNSTFKTGERIKIYNVRQQWPSGNMPDCGVRGPRFESHRGELCLSRQPLRYTALGTGCA